MSKMSELLIEILESEDNEALLKEKLNIVDTGIVMEHARSRVPLIVKPWNVH